MKAFLAISLLCLLSAIPLSLFGKPLTGFVAVAAGWVAGKLAKEFRK